VAGRSGPWRKTRIINLQTTVQRGRAKTGKRREKPHFMRNWLHRIRHMLVISPFHLQIFFE
jgi:hypothetical protein